MKKANNSPDTTTRYSVILEVNKCGGELIAKSERIAVWNEDDEDSRVPIGLARAMAATVIAAMPYRSWLIECRDAFASDVTAHLQIEQE